GGHSDLVAGLAVVKDNELAERLAFIQNSTGGVLAPFDSFLLMRGVRTLAVRMDRHTANAEEIARHLAAHPAIKKIYYPGLETAQGHDIQKKQAKNGGAMVSFELSPERDIKKFFPALRVVTLAESLGGVESLVCHPATMTHAAIPKETREAVGITDGLIRLSVGIEDADDLIRDLDNAIRESEAK
ncbi:MAG: PLP-dependent transferase, partial [Schwartzia sp.]|nr:PLP-dependent transferase [Schwartzia sp. (in: firmicutes)]